MGYQKFCSLAGVIVGAACKLSCRAERGTSYAVMLAWLVLMAQEKGTENIETSLITRDADLLNHCAIESLSC